MLCCAPPAGKGKSTLLRLIARRQIPVPENLDVLLVEQEVVGTEQSALASVVAADLELMQLREEEAEINRCACGSLWHRLHVAMLYSKCMKSLVEGSPQLSGFLGQPK